MFLQIRLKRSLAQSVTTISMSRGSLTFGKVNHTDLAVIDRNDHSLRKFNNGGLELCLIEIRDRDCLLRDPAATNERGRNRKALDDFQCERA